MKKPTVAQMIKMGLMEPASPSKSIHENLEELLEGPDACPKVNLLFNRIKASLPELSALLEETVDTPYEDRIYRFYHGSYKVFYLQMQTQAIVTAFEKLMPDYPLNDDFLAIVGEGTNRIFSKADNKRWAEATRPIVEAFLHAKYFLEMMVKYGKELDYPPVTMPSGWAAVLYLYNLR